MSDSSRRATQSPVASSRERGVAYDFWARLEKERTALGWSKFELFERVRDHVGEGPAPARSTIDNLRTSSRPPQARIVNAIADVLGIPRDEAHILANLTDPPRERGSDDVRAAIEASAVYTDAQRRMLLDLVDLIDQANTPGNIHNRSGGRTDTG